MKVIKARDGEIAVDDDDDGVHFVVGLRDRHDSAELQLTADEVRDVMSAMLHFLIRRLPTGYRGRR